MDVVSLALAKNYTNEKLNSLPSNRPTKTVSFDGGIYSVGNDVVNGQVSDIVLKGNSIFNHADNGVGYANWAVAGTGTTKGANGIHLLDDGISERAIIPVELKPSTTYTVVLNISAKTSTSMAIMGKTGDTNSPLDNTKAIGVASTGILKTTITTSETLSSNPCLRFYCNLNDTTDANKYIDFELYSILEGDYTQDYSVNKEFSYGTNSTNSVRIRSVNEDETKESIVYVNLPPGEELRSLPNDTKDEVRVSEGQRIQRVGQVTLNGSENWETVSRHGAYTRIRVPLDAKTSIHGATLSRMADGKIYTEVTALAEPYQYKCTDGYIYVHLADVDTGWSTNPTSTQVKNYFTANNHALTYQLAEPIVTKLPAQAPLQVFENGTVYVEPLGDPAETTLPSVELTVPIASGNKVGIATHDYAGAAADWVLTNNESKCKSLLVTNAGGAANIIAPDKPGLTFTINNKSGQAITIKKSGGTGVAITNGKKVTVQHFGTDYEAISSEI